MLARGRVEGAADAFYASPVAGDGKVYLVSEGGLAVVLPAGGGLEPAAVDELGEACYGTPALSRGSLFLRTQEALHRFDGR